MAISDKDVRVKENALKFCIANKRVPYVEVNIFSKSELTEDTNRVTDLDVLGVTLLPDGRISRTIFDCKTENQMSPINRAFWASGVMSYTGCDDAFVILKKRAVESHRLSAKALSVYLYQEDMFDQYAEASGIRYTRPDSYCADISLWYKYISLFEKWKMLQPLGRLLNEEIPISQTYDRSFRALVSFLSSARGELDPAKNEHMAIFSYTVSSALLILVPLISDFRNLVEPRHTRESFEIMLRYFIWGGRDNYSLRLQMKKYLSQSKSVDDGDFELKEWQRFLELVRSLLDAPTQISSCCLPVKEVAFRFLTETKRENDVRIAEAFLENARTRQFVYKVSEYLIVAANLPKDFQLRLEENVNSIIEGYLRPQGLES